MERTEWLNRLEALHVRIREGQAVGEDERAWYRTARARLLGAAVEVQARTVAGSARPRHSIRVARPGPVLLEAGAWSQHAQTIDLGTGGFAVFLEEPPPVDDWIRATLLLSGGAPATVTVAVADTRSVSGMVRVAFRFSEAQADIAPRVEDAMMDGILDQLVFWDDVLGRLDE